MYGENIALVCVSVCVCELSRETDRCAEVISYSLK